jgi:hypothetical protein
MSHVVHNLPWIAWGGLLGWLFAKAHRGWVVNLLRRRVEGLLVENSRLRRRHELRERPDASLDALSAWVGRRP